TGDASVDQVVRVHHVAGIAAESGIRGAMRHPTHIHPAHIHLTVALHVHPTHIHPGQRGELIVRGAGDAVDPVVEHDGPLDVLVIGVFRVTDDQGRMEATV